MSNVTIDGIPVTITNPNLGAGAQGAAQKGHITGDPGLDVVVKSMPADGAANTHTAALANLQLPFLSSGLAAPLAVEQQGSQLMHVAPCAEGVNLAMDAPRAFPELIEIAHHLACLWSLIEAQGMAHGDIAPSSAIVLIDFDNARIPASPEPQMAGLPHAPGADHIQRRAVALASGCAFGLLVAGWPR